MATQSARVNRGPAAAPANRQAILSAARKIFAERGYDAPISAIAREAGVSQGVMYRHFPRRVELALQAFEDNFGHIESILDSAGDQAIFPLWDWLLGRALQEAGFIQAIQAAREEIPNYDGLGRLREYLSEALDRACRSGTDLGDLRAEDLLHAWRMAYGLALTARDQELTADLLAQSLSLDAVRRLFDR